MNLRSAVKPYRNILWRVNRHAFKCFNEQKGLDFLKPCKYILLALLFLLSIVFIRNDVIFVFQWMRVAFYCLCGIVAVVAILMMDRQKPSDTYFFFFLVVSTLVWSFAESLAFGLLLPLLITMSRVKKFHISNIIISSLGIIVVSFLLLVHIIFTPISEDRIENTYDSPNQKTTVFLVYADTGATGGAYKLIAQTAVIKDCIYLKRRIAGANASTTVTWRDNHTISANYSEHTIFFP